MMTVRRVLISAVALALAAPAFSGAAASAGADTKQVNVTQPFTIAAAIRPVAGSAKYLAYLVRPTPRAKVLKVRDVHGKTIDYGVTRYHTFSLAGTMLTGSVRYTGTLSGTRGIGWWNLETHKTGRLAIPKDRFYLGAAPDGVLLISANGTVTRMTLAGKVTHLGRFHSVGNPRTSDNGFVVTAHHELLYQKWGHPGVFTRLKTGGAGHCGGMSASYVACDKSQGAVLVRLNGGPLAAMSNSTTSISNATLGGNSVVYAELTDPDTASAHYVLGSIGAGESAPQHSSTSVLPFFDGVTAYGLAVFRGTDDSLIGATDATHVTTLVPPVPTQSVADEFFLVPGRIVWDDDLPDAAFPGYPDVVRQRAVHTTNGHVSLGKASALSGMSRDFPDPHVYADTHATAWEDADQVNAVDGTVTATSRFGTFTTTGLLIGVSNRWLATQSKRNTVSILDMKQNTTTAIHGESGFGLSSHWLATEPSDNQHQPRILQVTDLATGHRVTVARTKHKPSGRIWDGFMAGNWIGWNDANQHGHARNLATMKPATVFNHSIANLGRHDALLVTDTNPHRCLGGTCLGPPSNYYVASYTGHETKVLSKVSPAAVPQVDGHLLAWINLFGQLEARAIKLPK
jgi:hypothetical protein